MYIPFEEMPDTARVWVYQSNRKFSPEDLNYITERLTAFCNVWNTHGNLMPTSFDLPYEQFIVLAVDEAQLGASGCSIDSSVKVLKEIESELGLDLLDHGKVSFVNEGEVVNSKLPEVKNHIESGNLKEETPVFNPVVNRKVDLSEKWLIPAGDSWLKRYFIN